MNITIPTNFSILQPTENLPLSQKLWFNQWNNTVIILQALKCYIKLYNQMAYSMF